MPDAVNGGHASLMMVRTKWNDALMRPRYPLHAIAMDVMNMGRLSTNQARHGRDPIKVPLLLRARRAFRLGLYPLMADTPLIAPGRVAFRFQGRPAQHQSIVCIMAADAVPVMIR